MFSQYEDRYVEELESDLSKLREQLAKANERVRELEEIERKQSAMLEFYVNAYHPQLRKEQEND